MLEVAQAAGDRTGEGRALVWVSYVRRRQYQPAGSETAGETGLRVAEELGEPRLLALAHWNLGHLYEVEGDLEKSAHHGARGRAHGPARRAPDHSQPKFARFRPSSPSGTADTARGSGSCREALALAREGHDGLALASAYWRLGLALGELGQYALAQPHAPGGRCNKRRPSASVTIFRNSSTP